MPTAPSVFAEIVERLLMELRREVDHVVLLTNVRDTAAVCSNRLRRRRLRPISVCGTGVSGTYNRLARDPIEHLQPALFGRLREQLRAAIDRRVDEQ
jgi:hypothetical protein